MTPLGERLAALLDNPNVKRYQFGIRSAEHGEKVPDDQRYSRTFGNGVIADLSTYDTTFRKQFKQTDGKTNYTTAQGAYQFLRGTWAEAAQALGLTDFSPRSQDIAQLWLSRRNGSLQDIVDGNFGSALRKDRNTWASLPGSDHPQPRQSVTNMARWLGVEPSKLPEAGVPGSFKFADGTTVSGSSARQHEKLMQIAESDYDDGMKQRLALAAKQLPATQPDNLFGSDLPTMLDKELMQLIETA